MKVTIIGANSYIARNLIVVFKKRFPETSLDLYDYALVHVMNHGRINRVNDASCCIFSR